MRRWNLQALRAHNQFMKSPALPGTPQDPLKAGLHNQAEVSNPSLEAAPESLDEAVRLYKRERLSRGGASILLDNDQDGRVFRLENICMTWDDGRLIGIAELPSGVPVYEATVLIRD